MSDEVKRCMSRAAKGETRMPEVVSQIVSRCDHARLVELYYWSQEPGLLEIIRAIAGMPESGREALESFFRLGGTRKRSRQHGKPTGGCRSSRTTWAAPWR